MGANDKKQSAIREMRDQLFLDTADDIYLNVTSANLGLNRPVISGADDEWRAFVKSIALQPKLIENIFYRALEVVAGPQKSRIAHLSLNSLSDDQILQTTNSENLLQIGTITIDPGLTSEETLDFGYRDLSNNYIYLDSKLANAHTVVVSAFNYLKVTASVGSGTLTLYNTTELPNSGYPYAIIIDQGEKNEELLVVTNNNRGTGVLTLQNVTTKEHIGSKSKGFIRTYVNEDSPAKSMFIQLDANKTRVFGTSGFVRLNSAGVTEEVVEFISNDVINSVLNLNWPTVDIHSVGESVELVTPGSVVSTLNIIQRGKNWSITQPEPRRVKIYLTPESIVNRLTDASFLHATSPAAVSTTLTANGTTGDTVIQVTSTSSFREGTGALLIDGVHTVQYLHIVDATHFKLTNGLPADVTSGDPVASIPVSYLGTSLEKGNLRTSGGSINSSPEWSGPYLYDTTQYGRSMVSTTLASRIPPAAIIQVAATPTQTCIEVDDISLWPTPSPFYNVKVGRNSEIDEPVRATFTATKVATVTTVTSVAGSVVNCASTSLFPRSPISGAPCGYNVIIDRGNANEEILKVLSVVVGSPGSLTMYTTPTITHSSGEPVELVHDVITTEPLLLSHAVNAKIEKIVNTVDVVSASSFPSSGVIWLNFGSGRPNVRQKISTVISSSILEFDSTSAFPTTGYPYQITVGQGIPQQEYALVTDNDTTLKQLTLQSPLVGSFSDGQYVEYHSGDPITVPYNDKGTTSFTFTDDIIFDTLHDIGESIIYSPGLCLPADDGTGYGFHMSPEPVKIFANLIKLIRAAGVKVFINDQPVGL
jgi:hypothetical protein